MPRESLDASEKLPKESPCELGFGQLQDEVAGMSDETPAGTYFLRSPQMRRVGTPDMLAMVGADRPPAGEVRHER